MAQKTTAPDSPDTVSGSAGGNAGGNAGSAEAALLPGGLRDLMPAAAAREAYAITAMMRAFDLFGYAHVKPPLVEFEETLLADDGPGAALAADTFRLMDPQSSRMLALRADMTAQIARIAATRLGNRPRPLRLSYHGSVLRVRADALNPERQLTQLGAEMIGAGCASHDAEVATAALTALTHAGVKGLTIDLGAPRLLDAVLAGDAPDFDGDRDLAPALADAVRAKDHAFIKNNAGEHAGTLLALLDMPLGDGGGDTASPKPEMPKRVAAMLGHLDAVAGLIKSAMGDSVKVTIDPLEARGFDYHHAICFAIFAPGVRGELGRGGRYHVANAASRDGEATGVTLYLERVLSAAPPLDETERLYVSAADGLAVLTRYIGEGRAAILGSSSGTEAECIAEAKALGCTHRLKDGKPAAL